MARKLKPKYQKGGILKKKVVDLAGQYFAKYSYYATGFETPNPGANYQTFSTVDGLDGIYEWRECFCFNENGGIVVTKNVGTATLLTDKAGVYQVNILTGLPDIKDGFTYIGRKKKGKKVLRYSLQSFSNTGTFTAFAYPTKEQLDDDACPVGGFGTNCGLVTNE